MCLDRQKDFKVKLDENGVGKGWKVFHVSNGTLVGDCLSEEIPRPTGKWLNEKDFRPAYGGEKIQGTLFVYLSGWHIFNKKSDAKRWAWKDISKMKKIQFRGVVAKGYQNDKQVIIAKEIFIPRENK